MGTAGTENSLIQSLNITPLVQNKMNIVPFQRCNSLVRTRVLLWSVEVPSGNFDNSKDTEFGVEIQVKLPKLRTSADALRQGRNPGADP